LLTDARIVIYAPEAWSSERQQYETRPLEVRQGCPLHFSTVAAFAGCLARRIRSSDWAWTWPCWRIKHVSMKNMSRKSVAADDSSGAGNDEPQKQPKNGASGIQPNNTAESVEHVPSPPKRTVHCNPADFHITALPFLNSNYLAEEQAADCALSPTPPPPPVPPLRP
jgi:hypothetical protein